MIGRLPRERELANSQALAIAVLESWLVYVCLLAGFFCVRTSRDERDFSARDFELEPGDLTYPSLVSGSQDVLGLAQSFVTRPEDQKILVAYQFRSAILEALAKLGTQQAEEI